MEDATTPDPQAAPPPWGPPADPAGWPSSPTPSSPPPPGPPPGGNDGETILSLSDEPWDHDRWAEPEMWNPDQHRKKSPLPFILLGGGVVALAAIALAIIFWPSSGGTGTPAANSSLPAQGQSPGAQSEPVGDSPSESGDATALKRQAGQVDALLTEMSSTRSELGSVVTGGCPVSGLERIRSQRQEQVGKAKALEVDALENGTAMRDALVRALEASVESNQGYLDVAPGCPSDGDVAPMNERASQAKREFVDYWRPNAEKAGLAVRGPDDI
ncbi:hypothetical protein GCM10010191_44020 [Actinomadura vinacea]|uniref:Uncharacterized protein n=1 Tax=Actinomadura vinacea TaxID=115336 RepID=A0ABN3JBX7_9ACTN